MIIALCAFADGLRAQGADSWRFTRDRLNGNLWGGDVGQDTCEEVNLVEGGGICGWREAEGTDCFMLPEEPSDTTGFISPVVNYGWDLSSSIIGGYVYRGPRLSRLQGGYIRLFCCAAYLGLSLCGWSDRRTSPDRGVPGKYEQLGRRRSRVRRTGSMSLAGDLYVLDEQPGNKPTNVEMDAALPSVFCLAQNFPSPSIAGTAIDFGLAESTEVRM